MTQASRAHAWRGQNVMLKDDSSRARKHSEAQCPNPAEYIFREGITVVLKRATTADHWEKIHLPPALVQTSDGSKSDLSGQRCGKKSSYPNQYHQPVHPQHSQLFSEANTGDTGWPYKFWNTRALIRNKAWVYSFTKVSLPWNTGQDWDQPHGRESQSLR